MITSCSALCCIVFDKRHRDALVKGHRRNEHHGQHTPGSRRLSYSVARCRLPLISAGLPHCRIEAVAESCRLQFASCH